MSSFSLINRAQATLTQDVTREAHVIPHAFVQSEIAETLRQIDPQKLPHNRQQPNTSAREGEATESLSRPKIPASM